MLAHAGKLGERIKAGFAEKLSGIQEVAQIRGQGLMIGIELDRPCLELPLMALERGLLINVTADKVVRLLPALVMNEAEAQQMVDEVSALIIDFLRGN